LRQLLADTKAKNEVVIDTVSADQVLEAGFSQDALDRAKGMVQSFEQFIAEHKDEITALQVPAPEVIAAEIVEDLEAALEQFREIAGDLAASPGIGAAVA
jgi:type I restriction enzyme R subunit